MDLAEFLLARIADKETLWDDSTGHASWCEEVACSCGQDPARVLAQCTALRAVVELHGGENDPSDCPPWGRSPSGLEPCDTLRALASIWADHPDFDPTWRLS